MLLFNKLIIKIRKIHSFSNITNFEKKQNNFLHFNIAALYYFHFNNQLFKKRKTLIAPLFINSILKKI
jgi:hypothetical protein